MKGYKGMNADMTCRGMPYKVGKSYHANGKIGVCSNGLHFCERLTDVFDFYKRDGNRFFEVEASGTIKTEGRKSAASDLRIVRELEDIEINTVRRTGTVGGENRIFPVLSIVKEEIVPGGGIGEAHVDRLAPAVGIIIPVAAVQVIAAHSVKGVG